MIKKILYVALLCGLQTGALLGMQKRSSEIEPCITKKEYQFLASDFFDSLQKLRVNPQLPELIEFLQDRIKSADLALDEIRRGSFGCNASLEEHFLGLTKRAEILMRVRAVNMQWRMMPVGLILQLIFAREAWCLLMGRIKKNSGEAPVDLLGGQIPIPVLLTNLNKALHERRQPLVNEKAWISALIEESRAFAGVLLRRIRS